MLPLSTVTQGKAGKRMANHFLDKFLIINRVDELCRLRIQAQIGVHCANVRFYTLTN